MADEKPEETKTPAADDGKPDPLKGYVPQAQFDELTAKHTALEKSYGDLADEILAEVPEHLKPLIPEGGAAAKLIWFKQAKSTGIFGKPKVPATDGGQKPAVETKNSSNTDTTKLSGAALLAAGYGKT